MNKIKTIFDRNWDGDRKVVNKPLVDPEVLRNAKATEKLDGTNVRITIRNHTVVRVEKRRNPSKIQKAKGIEEPWYVDADQYDATDKWIFDGLNHTELLNYIPDGEWSGELMGPNVQGNPLNLPTNRIVFFSLDEAPVFENAPVSYEELKAWLPKQQSKYGHGAIEGIVWHCNDGQMFKIKVKDF